MGLQDREPKAKELATPVSAEAPEAKDAGDRVKALAWDQAKAEGKIKDGSDGTVQKTQ